VPGVAFGDVDKLHGVTLFEMSYTKWGAKVSPRHGFVSSSTLLDEHVFIDAF